MAKKLTDKQQAFIEHYLQCWNASDAARLAGYSMRTAGAIGHENLKKPKIRAEIDERLKALTMSANEVLYRLTEVAQSDLGVFIGLSQSELKEHPQSRLIKKYKRTVTTGKDDYHQERVEIELHDPLSALVHIGRHYRLFTDRVQVEWRSEAVELIRKREIDFKPLSDEIGHDLATELFELAGVTVVHAGTDSAGSTQDEAT